MGFLKRESRNTLYDELWESVDHVCDVFTDEECYSFFKAAECKTD